MRIAISDRMIVIYTHEDGVDHRGGLYPLETRVEVFRPLSGYHLTPEDWASQRHIEAIIKAAHAIIGLDVVEGL